MATESFFNTEGPMECARHYCLNPLIRMDLPEISYMIHFLRRI